MSSNKPLVSVIIPTLNCASILKECLESIRSQTYGNIEIIVVDDHSIDDTPEIARKYGARVVTYGPRQNAPFARVFGAPIQQNYGASLCKGDYIYLVDSDMRLRPRVIEKCVSKIKEGADAVIVPEISTGESFWARCKMLEKLGYYGDLLESPRFMKKSVWDDVNGVDAEVGGFYDWDLTDKIKSKGYRIVRIDDVVIHYEGNLSLRKLIRKKYIYGKYLHKYLNKSKSRIYPNSTSTITRLTPYRLLHYFKYNKIMAREPTLILGLLFMKIFEFTAMLLGSITSKVNRK
jgi:glycosyltransferase involved in cell wall biosynthesis